ncbi:MAG: hypothetical protein Q8L14_31580 [Myxococcales bacterium]|nr:hypothetical protein [Myxococcales bacterium]
MIARASSTIRQPRGYLGKGHETIGSDIIAVFEAVRDAEPTLCSHWMPLVRTIDPHGWYPIDLLLTLADVIHERAGSDALASMGRSIFMLSHGRHFPARAASIGDLVFSADAIYRRANRGTAIGGWRVLEFAQSLAVIEKTTPHLCQFDEGIMQAGGRALGVAVTISQRRCLLEGDDTCEFVVEGAPGEPLWMGGWPVMSPH